MFFTIVLGLAIYIEWYVFEPMLGFLTLFFGVFIGFYSVKDIYDGTWLQPDGNMRWCVIRRRI